MGRRFLNPNCHRFLHRPLWVIRAEQVASGQEPIGNSLLTGLPQVWLTR